MSLHAAPEQTGNAPYVSSLVSGLAAAGWSVRLVAAHPHYPQWRVRDGYGQWRRVDDEHGVRVERLRHYVPAHPSGLRRLLAEASFGARLVLARWGRPDAIIFVSPAMISSALAMTRARLTARRIPTLVWVQDLYSRGMDQTGTGGRVARSVITRLESDLLRSAGRVVVIHDRFAATVRREFDIAPERVDIVRNWSHLARFERAVSRQSTRALLGWGDEIVVVHGGNQGVKQGLENIVDAARLADVRGARVRFVLIGHGSQHARLREHAGATKRIDFLPPMEDEAYTAALAAADVLVVNEAAGVSDMAVPSKLTTYFRAGRPVVAATDAGSITGEEVGRSGAGIRVDAGDPERLLDAVMAIGADEVGAALHGAAGLRFADENLGQDAAVSAFSRLLNHLIASRRRR